MHVPDHYLDSPTSAATAAVALAGLAIAARRSRDELGGGSQLARTGLVAAFVFAAQMINFPVGPGTSGHLMGGVLAAVLLGPATATLCVAAVLVVQAVLFADGGITALGTNITLMALVGVMAGWAVHRGVLRLLPAEGWAVPAAAATGALVSVPASAVVFTVLYAIGGTAPVAVGEVFAAMVGWHALIGVGEAAITFVVVAVAARAPSPAAAATATLVLAGVVSAAASSRPDGLEYVASAHGFAEAARESLTAASPLADYPHGWAGVVGCVLVFALAISMTRAAARFTHS